MHQSVSIYILCLILVILSACTSRNQQFLKESMKTESIELPKREAPGIKIEPSQEMIEPPIPYLVLSMSQEDCIGKCPVYKWSLISDGTMKFTGEKDVTRRGVYEGKLTEEQVQKLKENALAAGLLQMSSRYPEYGKVIEEVPATILYFRNGGQSKSIVNKHHAPKALLQFQKQVKRLIENSKWSKVKDNL